MKWEFNDDMPIYLQIIDLIRTQIAVGILKPNEKLPSVREMAIEAGVNPNTMQKALSELERDGLLYSQRTTGRFVADNKENTDKLHRQLVEQTIAEYLDKMSAIGYSSEDAVERLKDYVSSSDR